MTLGRGPYKSHVDFLSHLGSWDHYALSGKLRPTPKYHTLTNPFDKPTWILVAVSIVSVSITLVFIDWNYASWNGHSTKYITRQSKKSVNNMLKLI